MKLSTITTRPLVARCWPSMAMASLMSASLCTAAMNVSMPRAAAVLPAELRQPLLECGEPDLSHPVLARVAEEHGNAFLRLLRAHAERRDRPGEKQRAALHLMTSSARSTRLCGTAMPSALAAL